ncbi:hypothetical protein PHYBOEH_004749 [Phytophthora boehmeriae]|uniref:START domain-containing protein n=1 Tax=Phytophthora boehmeriae TaxID=109152 RepID=A0A8T1X384_9STRA|nr:hypothetical protein PHYBOEH_004749 [Phytophthora boehmeriae]
MTQHTPSFSRSRASQRSMRRLAVPTLSMSLRSRRAQQPMVTLGLQQLDTYHDRAEKALSEAFTAYGKLGREVDNSRWKCIRSKQAVRLFRGRQPTSSGQTPLMCVGALRGRFDDVMEGLYCQNTKEMLLTNAVKCPRLSESSVLYSVQRQTAIEPYAFTGIKWATIKLSVSTNRDLCYFDKMGMIRQTSGKRMAYHVMQSVNLAECPPKATHKRVQASLCYLFEELEEDLVGIYMQGEMDSAALTYFASPAMTDVLLAVTNAMECARAKKLAEMMSVASPGPSRRSSTRRFKHVCRRCRLKENVLARDSSSRSHLVRAEFCRVCISKTDSMSMDELRDECSGYAPPSVRDAENSATRRFNVNSVAEEEDVNVPGSDRSLTAFTLKISAQLQSLGSRSDARASNLSSMEKVSMSEDEDDVDLEREGRDVLNSIGKKGNSHLVVLEKDPADTSRRSTRSTASTASSSYYHEDEDTEQYRTSLFARLLQVSNQAEATFHLAREQSLIAHSVWERNRKLALTPEGSAYSQ